MNHVSVEEVEEQPDAVIGMFLVKSFIAIVLFHTGASHAYILLRLELALDFPEEERMMQQSSVSISLSFENQGINPVGGHTQVPRTCTKR